MKYFAYINDPITAGQIALPRYSIMNYVLFSMFNVNSLSTPVDELATSPFIAIFMRTIDFFSY